MYPNPTTATIQTAHSETLLRRILGGMSIFTMLMTIPQVLTVWLGSSGRRDLAAIVERVSCLCRYLVLVRDTETRQEHLFAVRGLDRPR